MSAFTPNDSGLNSGHRKPTADSTSYTVYKPNANANNRSKFASGGSIDEANP